MFQAINKSIASTGIEFDWYDPDIDCEDSVLTYVRVLNEKCEQLDKIAEYI